MRAVVLVCAMAWGAACGAAEGILIQCESPDSRESADKEFGGVFRDPGAFGGEALTRFFIPGSVGYKFSVPGHGEYAIWVRYATKKAQRLRYAMDPPAAGAKGQTGSLPATGTLEGPGAWRWERLGQEVLEKGEHRIVLQSAPIRLDCLWIGTSGEPPESPAQGGARDMGEVRKHLENPIEPIAPGWLAEADNYRLPEWYEAIRVCAHTRLSWSWFRKDPERFLRAGERLASVGFKAVARHMRSGSEAVWWPSAVGDVQPEAKGRDFAKEIIDEAHNAGCRIILYHRHMEDEWYAREHPDCRVLDVRGRPVEKRGPKVCLNTPFADFVQTRLVELAKMGADGLYFDEVHMEKPICWCPACRAGFKEATGMEYPEGADPYDPAFQKAIEYKNVVMERVFRKWREAIHAANPECVMLIGSNTYPAMNDRHFTHRLCRVTDSMKSEFNLAARLGNNRIFAIDKGMASPAVGMRIALGYAICRDSCDGRPAHVWTHGLEDPVSARFAAAGMIAHGLVANLDVQEGKLPQEEVFADAVALGNRVAPAFAGMRPLRWGLIHFSEWARDYYLPDEAEAWRKVLYPTYGAFAAMMRERLPVGVLTDSQLEQGRLDGCRVLFLPAPDRLSDRMRAAVEGFRARGGLVVAQRDAWRWHDAAGGEAAAGEFLAALGAVAGKAPVAATGGGGGMQMVAFSGGGGNRLSVALVNDFAWVHTGGKPKPGPGKGAPTRKSAEGENEPSIGGPGAQRPPAIRGVTVCLRCEAKPTRVRDLASGKSLAVSGAPGDWRVAVPEFDCLAVLALEQGR